MSSRESPVYHIADLQRLMERLRDPDTGCPWDLKQTYQSIAPYTLQECLELIDALEQGDLAHVEEELGDLLFSMVNLARHLNINADHSLNSSNNKFIRRFMAVEKRCKELNLKIGEMSLTDLDKIWDQVKEKE